MVFWVGTRLNQQHTAKRLLDNSPTNQLAISQDADWSTRRQRFINHGKITVYFYTEPKTYSYPNLIDYLKRSVV